MLGASSNFPGLARLRQLGQQMIRVRQAGQQGDPSNPAGAMMPTFNPMPGAPQNLAGGNYLGAGEGQQGDSAQDMSGQMGAPQVQADLTPQPMQPPAAIEPPAMSSMRDQAPQRSAQRGLGSYRQAGQTRPQHRGML